MVNWIPSFSFSSAFHKKAILLVGPTGAGKTPLGNLLENKGLWGKKCYHLDFGENLRQIAAPALPTGNEIFTRTEIDFIRDVLEKGVLLENEHFYIAKKIIESFISRHKITGQDLIVLNGLPRHIGQAKYIRNIIAITKVVYLSATAEVIFQRIRNNVGGDRHGRIDDNLEAVTKKLDTFHQRTDPMIDFYRQSKTPIEIINIEPFTTETDILQLLNELPPQ